jgi:hypothetical protein
MLPILGIASALASSITAGQAALIGAATGAVVAIGANSLSKKQQPSRSENDNGGNDSETADEEVVGKIAKGIVEYALKQK